MKLFLRLLFILAVIVIAVEAAIPSQAAVVDKIKAVVNNEVITQSEIDHLLYPIYMRYKDIYNAGELDKKLGEASDEILNQLIEDRLLLSEAKKRGIQLNDSEIDRKIEELRSRFPGEGDFDKLLKEENLCQL